MPLNRHGVDDELIVKRVSRYLLETGMYMQELASRAGVHESAVRGLLIGKREHGNPYYCTLNLADKLCIAMGIHLNEVAPYDPPSNSEDE